MKKFGITTIGAIVAAIVLVAGGYAATQAKSIAFLGKYTGNAVTKQADTTVTITASGTGTSAQIGAGKVIGTGTADSSQRPCVPFTGTGSLTGPKGTIQFKVIPGSTGCGDESGEIFSISGKANVVKATGKAVAKAKGLLKFTGTYDRSSGDFSVKFFGTLKA